MEIVAGNHAGISKIATLLQQGEVCAVPSETVYGLAANALDPVAVGNIFSIKGRPHSDPLIVHICDLSMLRRIAIDPPDSIDRLAAAFWPGPLTLILHKSPVIPDIVTAGRPTVAVRLPAHPVLREVIARCGFPLAAPSANPFGYISPTRAEHVATSLGDKVSWGIDGGDCEHGLESTILNLTASTPTILRQGPILPEMIEAVIGERPLIHTAAVKTADTPLLAPGTLLRHYSPVTPVILVDEPGARLADDPATAVVWWSRPAQPDATNVYWLTAAGDPTEAAHNLYSLLHSLDAGNYSRIVIQRAPAEGLGRTVNDRLQRAAACE